MFNSKHGEWGMESAFLEYTKIRFAQHEKYLRQASTNEHIELGARLSKSISDCFIFFWNMKIGPSWSEKIARASPQKVHLPMNALTLTGWTIFVVRTWLAPVSPWEEGRNEKGVYSPPKVRSALAHGTCKYTQLPAVTKMWINTCLEGLKMHCLKKGPNLANKLLFLRAQKVHNCQGRLYGF